MKCLLCDINPAMREAWEKELERRPRLAALCSVVAGGITDLRVDAVVSPANSFGFMRGGVDGVYTRVFGVSWPSLPLVLWAVRAMWPMPSVSA